VAEFALRVETAIAWVLRCERAEEGGVVERGAGRVRFALLSLIESLRRYEGLATVTPNSLHVES
jgi:hypothetical protein